MPWNSGRGGADCEDAGESATDPHGSILSNVDHPWQVNFIPKIALGNSTGILEAAEVHPIACTRSAPFGCHSTLLTNS